jgi:hypothetical protein
LPFILFHAFYFSIKLGKFSGSVLVAVTDTRAVYTKTAFVLSKKQKQLTKYNYYVVNSCFIFFMKKILFTALAGFILCSSILFTGCNGCKEIGPNVILTAPPSGSGTGITDTTWVLSSAAIAALTTDPHNVLVEEFTGQACSNCPAAHALLDGIAATYASGRVNIVSMYFTGGPQTVPPNGFLYDLRDSSATQISTTIYNSVSALPSGGVDRLPNAANAGSLLFYSSDWSGITATQQTVPDSVNLALSSSYNTTTSLATTTITVTYTHPVSTKQNISLVVVEDSITDLQEFPDSVHTGYHFKSVMRGMENLSIPSGDPVLDSIATKATGRVFRRICTYKLRTLTLAIKPANCHVVAFVTANNGADQHVMQSAQSKLIGP